MRKLIYILSLFVLLLSFPKKAVSITDPSPWPDFTPLMPTSPQFCVMCIPAAVSTAVSYSQQVPNIKNDLEKYTDMTKLKQMALNYGVGMGNTYLNKWRKNRENRQKNHFLCPHNRRL